MFNFISPFDNLSLFSQFKFNFSGFWLYAYVIWKHTDFAEDKDVVSDEHVDISRIILVGSVKCEIMS